MGRNKSAKKKEALGKKLKQNRRVPLVASAKTKRKFATNKKARHWRHRKLKLKVE